MKVCSKRVTALSVRNGFTNVDEITKLLRTLDLPQPLLFRTQDSACLPIPVGYAGQPTEALSNSRQKSQLPKNAYSEKQKQKRRGKELQQLLPLGCLFSSRKNVTTMKLFFTDACLSLFLLLLTTTGASKSTSSASFTSPTADHSFDNDAAKDTADNLARQLLGRELDRRLEAGDFDSFNELFENAKIVIDDEFEVKEKAGLWTLVLWLSNIRCFEISVQDIVVEHSQPSNTQVDVSIDIVELDLTCDVDYRYDYGPFRGSGWVRVFTDNNKASTDLRFVSPSFDTHPPLSSSVTDCVTDIEITNMDFNGGIVANLVDLFERLIRNPIEGAIEGVACDELGSLGTSFVTDMLDVADEVLFQYEGDLGDEINDPLYLELTTQLPETIQPLNLQDTDSLLGGWVSKALEVADNLLGSRVPDPENDSQDDDLGVNILLRTHLLDENRALVVDVAQLMDNNVLFEGHDKLTETSIALNSIKVLGLDTLTRFNPMIAIGQRTLQNELTWEYLTLEFDVTVSVKPSSKTDAILQDATSEGITERISIDFTIPDVDIVASLFLVIDQEALGSMEIGPLLHFDNLLPCLLSIIPIVELSGLEVSPTLNVNTPTLNGFSSPGLDRLLSNSIQAAFDMYKGVLTTRLPNIFQTSVRNLINRDIIGEYMEENPCPSGQGTVSDSQFVDFRDFFESNDYGNLPPLLKNLVDDELLATDPETGKPRINEILITPYTKAQSGVEGSLKFANELFAFSSKAIPQFGLDSIQLQVFDVAIENLDTLGAPLELLQPNSTNGFVLDNYVTFDGNATESLRFSIKGLFALNGGPELEISNEMELSLAIEEPELFASILAKVDSEALASFPLGNIIDGNCWLALLATPLMGESGYIVSSAAKGLSLETLLLSYPSFQFDLSCSNCTNSGSDVIPALLEGLEDIGVSESLEQRLFGLGLDLVRSDFFQAYLNRLVVDGSLRCPHSPYFEGESASSNYPIPSLPSLSYESLESVAFASTILMQVAIVVIAESHASYDAGENDPLSGQALLDASSAYNFVDFMSLESSIGEWADVAVDQLLDYLSATIDDPKGEDGKDLRINSLIRSTLLDEAGLLEIMFDDLNFGGDNMEVSLDDIRVVGLDTISSFDILDAIGSQTLRNRVKWDNVGIEVIVSLMVTEDSSRRLNTQEDITIYLELSEIDVSLALLLAMDLDLLGSIELSSMLEVKNILPCLLTAAREAELTELQVVIGSISEFSINGFRSSELQDFSTKSTRFIMDSFGDIILSSMPGFFDRTVRALLNNWIDYYMGDSSNVACDSVSFEGTTSSFVDFRDLFLSAATSRLFGGSGLSPYGDLFKTALEFVQDLVLKIDASTGLSKINDILIAPLTRSQSESAGTLVVPGDLFNSGSRVQVGGLDANVQLRASDARVDNLDTIVSPLAVLEAVDGEAHELNNTVTFGVTDRPLRFAVRFLFSLIGDGKISICSQNFFFGRLLNAPFRSLDMQIRNDLDISLDLSNANVVLQAMLKVAESSFYTFPLRDTLDYNCWLAMMPAPELDSSGIRVEGSEATARLTELAASISHLNLNISCVECSGPRMIELTELLSSTEGQEAATEIANTLLGYVAELLGGNFLEIKIDRLLKDAARKCPHSPTYEADAEEMEYEPFEEPNSEGSISFLILIGGVTVGLILCLCVLLSSIRCFVRRRHKKWLSGLSARQLQRLVSQQDKEQEVESELNASTQSMFTSQDIPIFVRWSMPLIILANIGFFLSGHLSLGATVHIELQLAGEKFGVDQFFEFSMAKSTIDIWNAGGRELAIMILIFSVIWPYTKQLITLVLWFLPPTKLSVSRRGSILLWLDCLGKWSMIDIFVLVITLVAFRWVKLFGMLTSFLKSYVSHQQLSFAGYR